MMPSKPAIFNPMVLVGILVFAVFGGIWVWIILPLMESTPSFYNLSPLIAYPLYNIGVYFITLAVFGYILGALIYRQRFTWFKALSLGSFSFFNFSFVLDNVFWGPFYLSTTGQVLVPLGTASLEATSVDAFSATVWATIFPWVQGTPAWFILTYYVTAIIVIVLTSLLVTAPVFMKALTRI